MHLVHAWCTQDPTTASAILVEVCSILLASIGVAEQVLGIFAGQVRSRCQLNRQHSLVSNQHVAWLGWRSQTQRQSLADRARQ